MNDGGMPASRPAPSWVTSVASPCTSVGARTIEAPYAAASDCIPRHTPRTGMPRSAATSMEAIETPASVGSPGPGETTMPRSSAAGSSARAMTPARSIASLRRTRTSAPAARSAWTRLKVKLS